MTLLRLSLEIPRASRNLLSLRKFLPPNDDSPLQRFNFNGFDAFNVLILG
jgi:hypothetical protein